MPIQTLSVTNKADKLFSKSQADPKLKLYEIKKPEPIPTLRARFQRPDKAISDPQVLAKYLTNSKHL